MSGASYHESWWIRVKEEASHVNIEGVPNIVRSKSVWAKLFWLCILVANTAVCVFLVAKTIGQYKSYDVTSTNRLIQEKQAIFPTVTICNRNVITTSNGIELLRRSQINMTSDMLVMQLESRFKEKTGKYMSDFDKQQLSNFNAMLIHCSFNQMPCNASHFEWIWHPKYFGCYRFNARHAQPRFKSNMGGSAFGLVLELYAGLPNELKSAWPRGFYVLVQNASDYPYGLTPSPLIINTEFSADIVVKRSFSSQLNEWPYYYSECRVDEDDKLIADGTSSHLFERVRETNYPYSQETCIAFCAQLRIEQHCGCMSYSMPAPPPLSRGEEANETQKRFCTTPDERSCADKFYWQTLIKRGFIDAHCGLDKCPLECHKRKLSTTVSYYGFTNDDLLVSPEFAQLHVNETDLTDSDQLSKNLAKVSVFFDTISYTINKEQAAMSFKSLIGLIGGHLGISVMSIVGLIEFMAICACAWLRRSKKHADEREQSGSSHSDEIGEHLMRLKIDGVAKIVEAKSLVVKLFWSTLLVTLLAVCVWLIVGSVHEFLRCDVTTLTREVEDRTPLFPTITICPLFPFNSDTAADLIIRSSAAAGHTPNNNSEVVRLLEKWSLEQTGSHMNESVKRSLSQLEGIMNCRIGDRACNSSDFQWIWMPKYYGCYRFNSGFDANDRAVPMHRAVELTGSPLTFTIQFNSDPSKKVKHLSNNWLGHLSKPGFYVFVQNASHSPLNPTPPTITLTASSVFYAKLKRSFHSQWPYNFSDCRVDEHNEPIGEPLDESADSTIFDQARHSGYDYTRNTCIHLCAQLFTRRACRCDSFDLPPLTTTTNNRTANLCTSENETACASQFFYGEFMSGDFIKHNCSDKCPLECYSSQLNFNSMRRIYYPPNEDKNKNENSFEPRGYYMFSISYESPLMAIGVEERPKISLDELVGTIGGQLQLLLGMSLLSFVELIELGLTVCVHACRGSDDEEKIEDHLSQSSNEQPAMSSPVAQSVETATISSISGCQRTEYNRIEDGSINDDQVDQELRIIQHPLNDRSTDSAISFDSATAVEAVEAATISSMDWQQTTNEDQELTILAPSDVRPNEDVASELGTTTAKNAGAAIDSASCVSAWSNHEMEQHKHDQTLWQLLVASIQPVKISALPNIFHSHWLAFKAFWLLLLIAFGALCTMQVASSVADFRKFEVVSSTRSVTEHTAVFPTLTVCPTPNFNTDYAYSLLNQTNASRQFEEFMKNLTGAYLNDTDKQRLTNLDDMLTECKIGSKACNASDFKWLWHPVRLNCYSFIGNRNITTQVAGEANFAFHLVMRSSFYLYVHNASEWPFGVSSSQSLFVNGKPAKAVNVERSFYSQFNEWPYYYSDCRVDASDKLLNLGGVFANDPDKLFERSNKYLHDANYTYSRDYCVALCRQQATTRKCSCNNYNLGISMDGHEWCMSGKEQACADNIFHSEDFVENNCLSKCPLECNRMKLVLQLSSLPSGKNEVKIFYDTLAYTITEERPKMTIWELFGTLGGHLQLFLGMSPMSFLEIGEILLLAAVHRFRRNTVTGPNLSV